MKHKDQHTIPKSYLKPWCDPNCPKNQTPYIWIYNKEGTSFKKKSPGKSFTENNFYTIVDDEGNRILKLENGLGGLENLFTNIRRTKIDKNKNLSKEDKLIVCGFTAAMKSRTKAFKEHQAKEWGKALEAMDKMKEWAKTATSEQKKIASMMERENSPSFSYDEVKRMAESPIQTLLPPSVEVSIPIYNEMSLAILETDKTASFITSDSPCVWFDPEAYKRPHLYRSPGLGFKTIEVTLPVSPTHLLLFNWRGVEGYITIDSEKVDDLNRRTRFHSHKNFIVNGNYTKPIWFDEGVEPEDSKKVKVNA